MSDFTPDLDDPRTRGWGGHDASLCSRDADDGFSFRSWFFIYFLPPILIGFYIQSDSDVWRFYFGICLLLTLHIVIMPLYNYLTRKKRNDDTPEDYDPRAPTIVCDPQGLIIYDDRRIRFQWRWRELDCVLYDGDFLLITLRRGGTVEYGPRHISDADYGDIVAVASDYLNGKAPPLPPAPPAGLDYTWYEAQNTNFLSCINFLLLLLVLCILGPGLLRYGHGVQLGKALFAFCLPILILLPLLITNYRDDGTRSQITINATGLHSLTSNDGGIIDDLFTLPWADIAHIKVQIKSGHGTRNDLLITDRLSNHHTISANHLQTPEQACREIAAAVTAVIQQRPLPSLPSRNCPVHTAITPAMRYFFWCHVLLAAAITLTIGSCLHLNTCIIGNKTILPLAYGYLILAYLISLSEWNYRQKQNN